MNDNPFAHHRPTPLEDQAHVAAMRHFKNDMNQFAASRDVVKHLERNLPATALAVRTASQRPPQGSPILTDDGTHWHRSVDLFDNTSACHRPIPAGMEYAVVEHFPASGRNAIWSRGHDAAEVLTAFAYDQRQVLQTWTKDMSAQVKEFLAEKYPDHDMARVAESFMAKFATRDVSQRQEITNSHEQKHNRGIGI
ncbi:MAG: hypothetical protein M9920_00560 [Verrucomicrobiae bacterium]|nr:hypothetical protein [Verrucomicrobiae bacterium]